MAVLVDENIRPERKARYAERQPSETMTIPLSNSRVSLANHVDTKGIVNIEGGPRYNRGPVSDTIAKLKSPTVTPNNDM